MIEVEKLDGLSEYRKAAAFFLKFINHKYLVRDEEAIRITIAAILFSKEKHRKDKGTLFNFTVNNVKTFIYRYIEKKRYNRSLSLADATHDNTPLSILIKNEEYSQILNIINGLSGKKKKCVELLYYKGLNKYTISKELGVSYQTVYNIFDSLKKDFHVLQKER